MANIKSVTLGRYLYTLIPLFVFTIITAVLALSFGSTEISFSEIISILANNGPSYINTQIIIELRLPRILLAIAVGGGLSVAGAVFQAILMNPLAEPYILGVSSGGTFGAVLSMVLGLSFLGQQALAFAGALTVIILVYTLGRRYGIIDPTMMLLTGVMSGAFFSALLMLMITFVDSSFRSALFWLLGNLSLAERSSIYFVLPIVILISILLSLLSQKLNVISLGDESALHLGVNSKKVKNIAYITSSILVGSIVSVSGIIGFVGLLVPHICRIVLGLDNRIIIPASFFVGAVFLILADAVARIIIAPAEIPVGVVTAVIGAPLFVYLLRSKFKR
ncbi:MAG: iron ABC transporter [Ignavibacteriae bacterium HGW-Ignavibacteriae-2]|jgi:iron complex transport system permease protein|nr:iron ABC transporter permease [Bacteroidota bacterium]PKL87626.1 MAG: iron ABC transporter [Ignavibacteriae bacterium HGW-Ignavibacteriae-2]